MSGDDRRDKNLLPDRDRLLELGEEFMHYVREDRQAREAARLAAGTDLIRRRLRKTSFSHVAVTRSLVAPFEIKVPGSYWTQVGEDRVEVACPCGESVEMDLGIPAVCVGEHCPRAYLFTGKDVLVAFSPKGTEPVEEPVPDES